MANATGTQLAQSIQSKLEELKKLCEGIDEGTASSAPADRWSPKEILSHLIGPEGLGHMPILKSFLEKETPKIDLRIGDSFFTEKRAGMPFTKLLSEVQTEYNNISEFAKGLNAGQLDRKAQIPALKESPLGEFPTLAVMISGLGEYHLQSHIDHMREILQALRS